MNRTFREWSELGYRIHKGAHAIGKAEDGTPVFAPHQVWNPQTVAERPSRDEDFDENDMEWTSLLDETKD